MAYFIIYLTVSVVTPIFFPSYLCDFRWATTNDVLHELVLLPRKKKKKVLSHRLMWYDFSIIDYTAMEANEILINPDV